ncbi:DUF4192 domain-containing protein [Saccharothrix xinjiangensis]|uniref:DUF4192 domain-containing protein n=1 Tax=Saccharothrix xinjiangensis TaxID=204798 RepID=A0ABV9XVB9_9PSEU
MSSYSRALITTPSELAATIPHLLGYYPSTGSLVMITMTSRTPTRIGVVVRADLPADDDQAMLVDHLLGIATDNRAAAAFLVVVDRPDTGQPPRPLPARRLLTLLTTTPTGHGIPVKYRMWVAELSPGARWCSYDDADDHGTMPDPASSVLAVERVLLGAVTHGSREQIAEILGPDVPSEVLDRRAGMLAAAPTAPPNPDAIDSVIRNAETGVLPATDEEVVLLATTLATPATRDRWLKRCVGDHPAAVERLALALVRGLPGRWRAHAESVYAFAVYLRGDGVLARLAAADALRAYPGHNLAVLILNALQTGMHPDRLRRVVEAAFLA